MSVAVLSLSALVIAPHNLPCTGAYSDDDDDVILSPVPHRQRLSRSVPTRESCGAGGRPTFQLRCEQRQRSKSDHQTSSRHKKTDGRPHYSSGSGNSQRLLEDLEDRILRIEADERLNPDKYYNSRHPDSNYALQENIDIIRRNLGPACGLPPGSASIHRASSRGASCVLVKRERWGFDAYQQNTSYTLENHQDMLADRVRVRAYTAAIERAAPGRRMLDIGTGPFCLLARLGLRAGALSVCAIEHCEEATYHALKLLEHEANRQLSRSENDRLDGVHAGLTRRFALHYAAAFAESTEHHKQHKHHHHHHDQHQQSRSARDNNYNHTHFVPPKNSRRATVEAVLRPEVANNESTTKQPVAVVSTLEFYQGFSSEVTPEGGAFSLVVHEVLGHIAGSEGALSVVQDIKSRGLVTPDCVFIPRNAATLFSPTEELAPTCLERLLHRWSNEGDGVVHINTKYHTHRFPVDRLLAAPQRLEFLDFSGILEPSQHRVCEFRTAREAVFSGLHFHLVVNLDGVTSIDTLTQTTTWATTFVKILDTGILLPAQSRIACITKAELGSTLPAYDIAVWVGEPGCDRLVGQFSWEGSG